MAVLFVLLWHWIPQTSWVNWTPNGALGVDLFFVLSGYLITSILLSFRAVVDAGRKGPGRALADFYVRRTLRLFPLYYAVLAGVALWPARVSGTPIRTAWPWYATFLQNYRFFAWREWDGFMVHFWTLAVEEQYYLIWGVAVLLLSRTALRRFAIGAALLAVVTRGVGLLLEGSSPDALEYWRTLTPACFDGLGLGSLIALGQAGDLALASNLRSWSRRLTLPALAIVASFRLAPPVWHLLGRAAVACLAMGALFWAIDPGRPAGALGRMLEWRRVVEFGRRSYGLYVFHNIVPFLWRSAGSVVRSRLERTPDWFEALFAPPLDRCFWAALLVGLAYASWRFFEAPINSLKNRFAP